MDSLEQKIYEGLHLIKQKIINNAKKENVDYAHILDLNKDNFTENLIDRIKIFLSRLPKDYVHPTVNVVYDFVYLFFAGTLSSVSLSIDSNRTKAIFSSNDGLYKRSEIFRNHYLDDDIYFNIVVKKIYSYLYDNVSESFIFDKEMIGLSKLLNDKIYSVKISGSGSDLFDKMTYLVFINDVLKDIIDVYDNDFDVGTKKIIEVIKNY
ncbi:MAG: hypothetical protein QXS19_09365 [Candidatus Methanomethylicia archaeon]